MRRVTKENLIPQIDRLHKIKDEQGQLSMSGEYTLQAYEMLLATMEAESVALPLDYLQGHKDGLEWAAQLAEANHPETGDWLYDDPIELAKAIRKGPDMPTVSVVPGKWIPVSEQMPENKPGSYEYLVFETLNNRVNHDYWNAPDKGDDAFTPFWNYYGEHVTHWMPFPTFNQK